jgi:uncharacterized membrane protein
MKNLIKSYPVTASISIATVCLFLCSSLRHWLYRSNAWDLGIFDQAIYLISIGEKPVVSFLDFHILGDHAAIIFYPLALLYRIYPDVHWLFLIQAIALTIGGLPIYHLSLKAGLNRQQATTIVISYLLYPLVLNKTLFDFHPEVIAIPGFLLAVLAARTNNIFLFWISIILILSCKAVLSLTVISMGLWLMCCEHKRIYGSIAVAAGLAWFIIATQFVIPTFLGNAMGGATGAAARYSYLGGSMLEIATNIVMKPHLIISKIFSLDTLEYMFLLVFPIAWGLSPKYLAPLLSAVPMLLINILSTVSAQRNLVHQYSLPILPFLFIAVISTVANGQNWLKTRRNILIWAIIGFAAFGKIGYFWSDYLLALDTQQATTIAIDKIRDHGGVLTTGEIAPHLTHRSNIKLAVNGTESIDLQNFKYILLNQRHPGWNSSVDLVKILKLRAENSGAFELRYQQDGVMLFVNNLSLSRGNS